MVNKRPVREVVVLGAGLYRYGIYPETPFTTMGMQAVNNALKDAGVPWADIEVGYCSNANLGNAAGHILGWHIGANGMTMTNIENASASGNAGFREAYLAIASGAHDVALAVGVDKLRAYRQTKPDETQKETVKAPANTSMMRGFAERAHRHMKEYGTTVEQMAMVSVKNHLNGSLNPYAHYQKAVTMEEVFNARMVADPLTVLHCCPWDEGAAAVILCAKEVATKYTSKPSPRVLASVCTGNASVDPLVEMTQITATKAYEMAGVGPKDLNLVEVHDAATIEEILYYEALGLCPMGEGGKLIESGATAINGRIPVNTSGGLISMGHPIGPTGVGQIAELLWQMRGEAGKRQITKSPRIGLAHMVGAGGVCFIHILGL
ncbi:MAG: thiolase family protein [Dehalococcoidales bacterium]|nr:thiolase family protein [Dehalococcoidales bacterium]